MLPVVLLSAPCSCSSSSTETHLMFALQTVLQTLDQSGCFCAKTTQSMHKEKDVCGGSLDEPLGLEGNEQFSVWVCENVQMCVWFVFLTVFSCLWCHSPTHPDPNNAAETFTSFLRRNVKDGIQLWGFHQDWRQTGSQRGEFREGPTRWGCSWTRTIICCFSHWADVLFSTSGWRTLWLIYFKNKLVSVFKIFHLSKVHL